MHKILNFTVETVKKSMAKLLCMWLVKNVRQVWDGGLASMCFFIMFDTVFSETVIPSFWSSPWMRGAPQSGLAFAISMTSFRISWSIGGLPSTLFRDLCVQYSLNPFLCQWMTVSGCTMIREDFHPDQIFDSQTQKMRSRLRILGCFIDLLNTASCCRNARFSAIRNDRSEKRPRKNTHTEFIISPKVPTSYFSGQDSRKTYNRQPS